jgi:hypothetical protein
LEFGNHTLVVSVLAAIMSSMGVGVHECRSMG